MDCTSGFRSSLPQVPRHAHCSARYLALHAEANAILYAAKNKVDLEGCTLYVTLSPCLACARIIYSVGIKHVYFLNSYAAYKGIEVDEGVEFLRKFGVCVEHMESSTDISLQSH